MARGGLYALASNASRNFRAPSLSLLVREACVAELVSILIPVYNCREWVGRAIESALEQTWSNCEIIALDDCSTDGSWEVLQQWVRRIRIERAERNGGQNVSRNA